MTESRATKAHENVKHIVINTQELNLQPLEIIFVNEASVLFSHCYW